MAAGLASVWPGVRCDQAPLADGGEGTLDVLAAAAGAGRWCATEVAGPHGERVRARWWLGADGVAVVESAEASGLARTTRRDARGACSRGTGELLAAARDAGARHLLLGVGGSAMVDGGAGALRALGAELRDAAGRPLPPGGAALADLAHVALPRFELPVTVLCDVRTPLLAAAGLYGPQKGATPADVGALVAGLDRLGAVLAAASGRDPRGVVHGGAAGGLAGGLWAALGATLVGGFDHIAAVVGLDARIAQAELVITAEGRLDAQTAEGKVVSGVVDRAGGRPVVVLAGEVTPAGEAALAGRAVALPLAEGPGTLAEALAGAAGRLARASARAARLYAFGASSGRASAMASTAQ